MTKNTGGSSKGSGSSSGGKGPSSHSGPGGNWPSTTGNPSGGERAHPISSGRSFGDDGQKKPYMSLWLAFTPTRAVRPHWHPPIG